MLDYAVNDVQPGSSGCSLRGIKCAAMLLDWAAETPLDADGIAAAVETWKSAATEDELSLFSECMDLVASSCESLSQDNAQELLDDLDRSKKKGNLAFVLLECYGDPKVFNLTKNIKKLDKRDGIEWKNDLCLRPAALERAVRLQDGYQNYTLSKIARELKDMGALVIQEEGTLQVRLKKDTPRVYRIRFDALEEYEERF